MVVYLNEIFLNAATVQDIEIIDEHTATNLQTLGNVITSISTKLSGVQTRTVNNPTTLPSSSAVTSIVQDSGATIIRTNSNNSSGDNNY